MKWGDDLNKEKVVKNKGNLDEVEPLEYNNLDHDFNIDTISDPSEILRLPRHLRDTALNNFKERLAEKQLRIGTMQTEIFGYLREHHEAGTLDYKSLVAHIDELFDDPLFDENDRAIAAGIVQSFEKDYSRIREESKHTDAELLQKFSDNQLSVEELRGEYRIIRNALSFDFIFEKKQDFRKFVEQIEEGQESKGTSVGWSFYYDDVSLTATSENDETTFRHEVQHKEFSAINIDEELIRDSVFERGTRDEMLSFYIQDDVNYDNGFLDISNTLIDYYKFHQQADMSEEEYDDLIHEAFGALMMLEEIFSTKTEIVSILRKESIYNWMRIAKRLSESKVVVSYKQSSQLPSIKNQREGFYKEDKGLKEISSDYYEQQKKNLITLVKNLLDSPLVFRRHADEKGFFYTPITLNNIATFVRRKLDSAFAYKLNKNNFTLKSDVDEYGEYVFSISFDDEKIDGTVKVEEFK